MLNREMPTIFRLPGKNLTLNAAINVARILEKRPLSILRYSDVTLDHQSAINVLNAALPKSKITTLEFSGGELAKSNMETMANNLPATQIADLNFTNIKLADEGLKFIVDALPKSKVKALYLRNAIISDNAIKILIDSLCQSQLDIFYYTAKLNEDQISLFYQALSHSKCQIQEVTFDSPEHSEIANDIINHRKLRKQIPATEVNNPNGSRSRSSSDSSTSTIFYDCPSP